MSRDKFLLKKTSGRFSKNASSSSKLSKMISKGQWTKAEKFIDSHGMSIDLSECDDSILHQACRHQPPLDLIEKIVSLRPDLALLTNPDGQVPLHIASQNGASPDIIAFFCTPKRNTSGVQDLWGRTALHLACESYCANYTNTTILSTKKAFTKTVKTLIQSSPATINVEDVNGISAVEYAIESNIDLNNLRLIQKASERDWKRRAVERRSRIGRICQPHQVQNFSLLGSACSIICPWVEVENDTRKLLICYIKTYI